MRRPLDGERIISIKEVTGLKLFGRRPSYQKVWRWITEGVRGVQLESRRDGGTLHTSVEAVERFLERIA